MIYLERWKKDLKTLSNENKGLEVLRFDSLRKIVFHI